MCRRLQYEAEFCDEPPEDLAPNGYLVGTHKKLKIKNARKFKRHKVKKGMCLLQVLDTPKTFSAWVIDVSEGGMRLEVSIDPKELAIEPEENSLKILGHFIEDIPFSLTKEIVRLVWQNDREIGCSFVNVA
jgi:hypothetical protein